MTPSASPSEEPSFEWAEPEAGVEVCAVFASPHSGALYPPDWVAQTRLDPVALRSSEDAYVDQLIWPCAPLGFACLRGLYARAYVDVNRDPRELDPRLFQEPLPADARPSSLRVAAGLGVIARKVSEGRDIYGGPLPLSEDLARLAQVHAPYHQTLKATLERLKSDRGRAVLLDWHSMPSASCRADVVLGDLRGRSCAPGLTRWLASAFKAAGLKVALNHPYAGGWTTQLYGQPTQGGHALQIELSRGLYMDEARLEPNSGLRDLGALIETLAADFHRALAEEGSRLLRPD
ncbi:MAG: N-formylglutamate amidohydrolase [Asticcacaulis sp.]